ncbi:GAF domain-containing protein [bacterium]|nr:GAF domain-containing protein [bacterium]
MKKTSTVIESIRMLYEISTLIRSDSKLEEKFHLAIEKVREAVGCHSVSLFIAGKKDGKLEEAATVGTRVDLIESIDFDMGSGFSAWVAKHRRAVLIPNLRQSHHKHFRSFVSTPLISGDTLIGVMNLGHKQPDAFTEENLQFLEIIAEQLALLIERTHYEKELISKNRALVKAQGEIKKQHIQIVEMEKYQVLAQMAASINHEINNPLTTIIGNIELLLMIRTDLDETVRKKLTTVLSEAKRIAEITQKLRNMKRVVVENYLERTQEKMIDIDSSSQSE